MNDAILKVRHHMQHHRWNKRNARAYDNYKRLFSSRGWERFLVKRFSHIPENSKILDFGTGTGIMAQIMANLGHRVTGIDLSEHMLERAEANIQRAGLGNRVEFLKSDGGDLNFQDNTFDAVVSRWVIWTLPDPENTICEMARVIRPGGSLMVIDGKSLDQHRIKKIMNALTDMVVTGRLPWWRSRFVQEIDPLLPRYSLAGLKTVFEQTGLTCIQSRENLEVSTESWIRRNLLGYNWSSFMIQAQKPV